MEELPTEFDVIVVGTGLAESIVSAAVSRNGHKVLHLDPRDYYGGKWTSVNWASLESGLFAQDPVIDQQINEQSSGFSFKNPIRGLDQNWYLKDRSKVEEIQNLSRKFNIDVYPKVILAREAVIELLISSNVSRYLEFKCISRLYSSLPAPSEIDIEPVPLSRSDIFQSKSIGLIEKRKLTKFIESVLNAEETGPGDGGGEARLRSFEELARAANLTEKIKHLIHSAVKNVEDYFHPERFNTDFVGRCRRFLQSIGRYGNQTPYLWTLYGVGEICQAFCRLSAIYGGTYILKRMLNDLKHTEDGLEVGFDGSSLKCKYLVLGSDIQHSSVQVETTRTLVRAILLTHGGQIKRDAEENPDKSGSFMSVYKVKDFEIIELDYTSLAVPKPYRLVHVTGPFSSSDGQSPRALIESALESYLDFSGQLPIPISKVSVPDSKVEEGTSEESVDQQPDSSSSVAPTTEMSASSEVEPEGRGVPVVLHGTYFLIDFHENTTTQDVLSEEGSPLPRRIFHTSTQSTEITGEIQRAQEIFQRMYPEEEFLPKASDGTESEEPVEQYDIDGEFDPSPNPTPIDSASNNAQDQNEVGDITESAATAVPSALREE